MKKKIISLLLAIVLVCSMIPTAFAASDEAVTAADALHELGLFNGTGTDANGKPIYDLDRAPTRHEAVTMLVRLLGKGEEAVSGTWETPFTDVADWAKPYVGYAYANKLTSGTSATTFDGDALVTASQYITFVLRALGYNSGTDFQWDKAWELSDDLGITTGEYQSGEAFTRSDVARISVNVLPIAQKTSTETLAQKLMSEGVFTPEQYERTTGGETSPEAPQEEPFTLTAFGDKWLHEYLMSLDPTSVALGPKRPEEVRYFDQYYFTEQYIADEIVDTIQQHYAFVRVKEPAESGYYFGGPIGNPGTRVETLEHPVYGRFIAVATFEPEGYFYQTGYYLRWRTDRP